MVRVEALLDSWKTIRHDAAQAVLDCPTGELDFRPSPDLMTFREIARHILDAGLGLTGLLLDGVESMAVPEFREMLGKHVSRLSKEADAGAMATALADAMDLRCSQLTAQPPEFFGQFITKMDGQRVTRLEMLQFVKEHELTHRAQLFLYLRLKGIVPVTTRRRQARK